MKKILSALLLCIVLTTYAYSQNSTGLTTVYCEIIGTGSFSGKNIKISFDFGSEGHSARATDDIQFLDDKGKVIKFESMIDALNYMAKSGWKLVIAYSSAVKGMGNQETYRYIVSKEIKEGQSVMDGLNIKEKEPKKTIKDPVYE